MFPLRNNLGADGKPTPSNSIRVYVDDVLVHYSWGSFPRAGDDIRFWSYVDMSEFVGKSATVQLVRAA